MWLLSFLPGIFREPDLCNVPKWQKVQQGWQKANFEAHQKLIMWLQLNKRQVFSIQIVQFTTCTMIVLFKHNFFILLHCNHCGNICIMWFFCTAHLKGLPLIFNIVMAYQDFCCNSHKAHIRFFTNMSVVFLFKLFLNMCATIVTPKNQAASFLSMISPVPHWLLLKTKKCCGLLLCFNVKPVGSCILTNRSLTMFCTMPHCKSGHKGSLWCGHLQHGITCLVSRQITKPLVSINFTKKWTQFIWRLLLSINLSLVQDHKIVSAQCPQTAFLKIWLIWHFFHVKCHKQWKWMHQTFWTIDLWWKSTL